MNKIISDVNDSKEKFKKAQELSKHIIAATNGLENTVALYALGFVAGECIADMIARFEKENFKEKCKHASTIYMEVVVTAAFQRLEHELKGKLDLANMTTQGKA